MTLKTLKQPVFVSRPILPSLSDYSERLKAVWAEKWLTNDGKQLKLLEDELKKYLNTPHLSLFNNGTIALIVAVQSLKLTGEVITTPFSFPATTHVLSWNGLTPVFCDIEPDTMNIDASKIESMITDQTTGILCTHVYGNPCATKKIREIADNAGLKVVYDAAHCFGVEVNGESIGNVGDISMFSFHATKLFHTAEGGALSFRDPELESQIYYLKNFGIKNQEEVIMPGINGKMCELQAALGIELIGIVDEEIRKRAEIDDLYRRRLSNIDGISLIKKTSEVKNNYQYFVIKINANLFGASRDQIFEKLKEYNIFARKYFYPLCSNYPCYRNHSSANPEKLPVANKIAEQVLCLPMYGDLETETVEMICDIINGP